jgi:DNA-binding NarL/FixJ family response regulator
MTAIRLLLVDDDPLVRAGLSFMLGGVDDIEIVGEAADGGEVEALVDRTHPDVVLMDIRMPSVDGLTATERLRGRQNAPQIVVLTTFHADEQVLRALRAGAAGFVLKDTPPAEIIDAVRRVAAGDPVLSPTVTRQLMAHAAGTAADTRRARARERIAALGDREREVAVAVGRGRRPGPGQCRDRRRPLHERRHRQDPRLPHPGQARPQQPGADSPVGVRRGTAGRRRTGRALAGNAARCQCTGRSRGIVRRGST